MNLETLKKICRSNQMQILYNRSKEIGTLRLFNNDSDLSNIQIFCLYYLELYAMLYSDIQSQEEFINEDVIKDDLRCEAYLLYRRIKRDKNQKVSHKNPIDTGKQGSLIFTRRQK